MTYFHGCLADPQRGAGGCPLKAGYFVSSVKELRPEANICTSSSHELSTVPSFPQTDAPVSVGSASCLAMLSTCTEKFKPYPRRAQILKSQACLGSQKGNSRSSQSSRNHEKSPSAGR